MNQEKHYFFCGIGGSGMLPLAMILRAKGCDVAGSDRALDQGRTTHKFDFLRAQGIRLHPQDGTGVTRPETILVASAAVEDTVPDVAAANRVGAARTTRAELLAELFNAAPVGIAVGGTSGKSTTTGMIGWILYATGHAPTIMNGAVMNNFVTPNAPFASAVIGGGEAFVSEVDESDGSIARFRPSIAVLNNIAFDHKPLPELRQLFRDFVGTAAKAVLNLDNDETAEIAAQLSPDRTITCSMADSGADLFADDFEPAPDGIAFRVTETRSGSMARIRLAMPGRHNAANALAALAAVRAADIAFDAAARALAEFTGIRRRLDYVGAAKGITVIDDFAHNPDKITATLTTLHDFPGRLILMFQPHGFGPLRLMKNEFIDCFVGGMRADDILIMPEPVYFGGTVERTVSSRDIVRGVIARGREAHAFADRAACGDKVTEIARSGDRIIVLGARDDTLSQFAAELLTRFAD
ncbi:MAG: UDP-N-acetylmuramate--alanine ligase [Alphaproteobacteria bacterium]|nr:UDP-N-acetylmuramate--alanine ligase [Alphaproteobacteria bacterium]